MHSAINSTAFLKDLGIRLKNYRISLNLTQQELAEKSGVSLRSVGRFENGNDIQLSNLFKLLKAMALSDSIVEMIPDMTKRPSYYIDSDRQRKRAHRVNIDPEHISSWKWGDEK